MPLRRRGASCKCEALLSSRNAIPLSEDFTLTLMTNPRNVTELIVPADLCSGCGVCAGICPGHCLEMEIASGKYRPVLVGECLERCDLCLEVCPFGEHERSLTDLTDHRFATQESVQFDEITGYHIGAYVGYSTIDDQRTRGASGGMATWVLEQLLRTGQVDRVVAVGAVPQPNERLFQFEVYGTPEQVRNAASSKYYPVEISKVLPEILKESEEHRYAVIGLPCVLHAVRRATLCYPRLARRVRYLLGILCNHCPGTYYTEYLCALSGISMSRVERVDYRCKESTSAVDFQFRAWVDGAWSRPVGMIGLPSHVWNRQYFAYNACGYCDDVFAEAADAVFMDAWLPKYLSETRGTSIVLVRDAGIDHLLRAGREGSLCELDEITLEDVKASQASVIGYKRHSIGQRIIARRQQGRWLPQMRVKPIRNPTVSDRQAAEQGIRAAYLSTKLWPYFRPLPKNLIPVYCGVVDWISENWGKPMRLVLKEHMVKVLRKVGLYPVVSGLKRQLLSWKNTFLDPNSRRFAAILWGYALVGGWIRRINGLSRKKLSLLILPPSSPGSLGDQAVLTSVMQSLRVRGITDIAVVSCADEDDWGYLNAVGKTSVISGLFRYHSLRERLRFINTVRQYDAFFVLGTDVLDGAYAESASSSRLALAHLAHATGAKTSIISFSVNSQPTKGVVQAFKRLSPQIRLCARDPISHERLSKHLGRPVELSADIAFLLEPEYQTSIVQSVRCWIDEQKTSSNIVVGFNACKEWLTFVPELTADDVVQICANTFTGLVQELRAVSFVFVSHDVRGDINDFTLAKRIWEAMPKALQLNSVIVPECNAREIKGLCAGLDIALSGRMHFAIACLGQGVPVAGITYQDKFEGLFRHFSLRNMAISPERAFLSRELLDFFLPLVQNREALCKEVERHLPTIRQLAQTNLGSIGDRH